MALGEWDIDAGARVSVMIGRSRSVLVVEIGLARCARCAGCRSATRTVAPQTQQRADGGIRQNCLIVFLDAEKDATGFGMRPTPRVWSLSEMPRLRRRQLRGRTKPLRTSYWRQQIEGD
jgi:hypothetical protein